jgi:KaiC/GvpD/RAD55 family RecA-like ATPase
LTLSDLGRAALWYATELGWAVFPLRPGDKIPMTTHGLKDATTSADQITAWWTERPNANIGIATGEVSGMVVVDVDGPLGEKALARFGELPHTATSLTGKGRHIVFKRPADGIRNSAGKLGPQLDTRGDGGYIVAPPSVHPRGGKYEWEKGCHPAKCPVAELPAVIIEHLTSTSRHLRLVNEDGTAPMTAAEIATAPEVPAGQRNQSLTAYAGRLIAKGHSELETLELVRGLNMLKCKPPLPQEEVDNLVISIAATDRRNRSNKARELFQPTDADRSGLVRVDHAVFAVLAERNEQPIDAVPTMLQPWNDACRGFGGGQGLPRGWHITIGGASGTGKSLFALNLASSAIQNGHKVAYISLEMSTDQLLARLLAIFAHRSVRELEPGRHYSGLAYQSAVELLLDKCNDGAGLWIAERPSQELDAVLGQAHAAIEQDCRIIIVDYLQLVSVSSDGLEERTRRVSQAIQRLAFDKQVTTVALSQFNRATSYAKESPTVHGLTGSSAIENDSDQVLLLDHSHREQQGLSTDTKVLLAKNRHGPQPIIPVRWDFTSLTLAERAPTPDESATKHGIRTGGRL